MTPDDPDALAALAQAHRAAGRLAEALDCWRRVARLRPSPDTAFEVGRACAEVGRFDEAIEALRAAVAARPGWFDALTQLGLALGAAGRAAEAVPAFRAAADAGPNSPPAHHNLGVALVQAGRLEDGAAAMGHALRLQPAYPEAHFNLGNALAALGRRAESIDHYRQALALRPDYPEALNNLGLRLTEAGRPGEAAVYLRQAVRLRPAMTEAFSNLGIALEAAGHFEEAAAALEEALRLDPAGPDAHANLGNVRKAQGRTEEALACYQVALWLKPDAPTARYNRSLALLQAGDYAAGWAEYEWRLARPDGASRCPSDKPAWDGSGAEGKTVLVWAEQGLGDAVQFARFAPVLRHVRGCRVLVYCPGILHRLLSTLSGVDGVVAEGDAVPRHDLHCPLMSLPYRLGIALDAVPADVPYLAADPPLVGRWAERLKGEPGLKIGVYWQGNPHHPSDRHRSLPLSELTPLADVPGVRLVSLQQGPGREQIGRGCADPGVLDLGEDYRTPDDLAAAITQMDVVVSVDTLAAHLAGALGKPAWVLLAASPDWRWLMGRPDSSWYPTARLFRQRESGDWRDPVREVADRLTHRQ